VKLPLQGSVLAPFRSRNFRFQWPADLTTSWAFEMETLILGWYVLVETGSVFLLTVFVSLQQIGTLVAPMFGVVGDRIGQRNLLSAMRAVYAVLAIVMMVLAFTGNVSPAYVLFSAGIIGLVKPSDIGARTALVGDVVPGKELMGAMSIQRTTMDSARGVGALAGAGLVATLGMGWAYAVVASLYLASVVLTLKIDARGVRANAAAPVRQVSPWRDLKEGLAYVWSTPHLLAAMCLAFLLNLTAYPLMTGLLPYVAKEVHHADQTWLSYMVACAAGGALVGSVLTSRRVGSIHPARTMLVFSAVWYALLLGFAHWPHVGSSLLLLALAGWAQSVSQIPMATMLLRGSDEKFRGRVMGIRMLCIYGNIPGLLAAGPLVTAMGYPATVTLYCTLGTLCTLLVALRWRTVLWQRDAPANRR
jgi:predicted MFS family arabinose efflux permease